MIHFVYKTINKVSGSFYVGVHSSQTTDDSYLGSGKALRQAFKTYGRHNFKRQILKIFDTKEEAYLYEASIVTEEFIKRHDTYNLCIGGRVPSMTQEIKNKISKTVSLNPVYKGRTRPDHSLKMSGNGNPMYGISRKGHGVGVKNGYWKGWYVTPTGVFATRREAGKANGLSGLAASSRCKKNIPGWFFVPKDSLPRKSS
jgi:hypothetical protein